MSIADQAMTVNLHLGVWAGYRLDKEASSSLVAAAGAAPDAVRVNKHLAAKETLKPIMSSAGALRTHLFSRTLPWKDNGDRLLPRAMYFQFVSEHGELLRAFHTAVEDFIARVYPTVLDTARFRMGELFNADDYPAPETLRPRFYASLDIDSVTTADDFRVDMDASDKDAIRSQIDASTSARLAAAHTEITERITKVLRNFAERLAPKGHLHRSTFESVKEWVTALPKLDVWGDPQFEAISAQLGDILEGVDLDTIKKHDDVRADIQKRVAELVNRLDGAQLTDDGTSP